MNRIVAYLRVSTARQGISGLGLEGQEAAVEAFAKQQGGEVVAVYHEVESGKKKDRPELKKALSHAKRSKATLVVAKLDRLARNVSFLSDLMESDVQFVAVDNPFANQLTVHVLSAVAEFELKQISERTQSALAAAKRRGVKLGSAREAHWVGREDARKRGAIKGAKVAGKRHQQDADEAYEDLVPVVTKMREDGKSYRQIASELNDMGHTTRRGKDWNGTQVMRLVKRYS
ncbi:recombinase family protein [Fuerstiella marisgermanici]|uniref:DNA-invertase hin n=1 Tax=Fuerstiella marisgermanici TaxID=1891926 RepID=A0A1P8WNU3_9PLAN|nr:recombinase family protein [Fuerstiella marisgermanici]APZ95726.1 DNA-invertase hin [Fuerstiella marisgermanici]